LLVEDDAMIGEALEATLSEASYAVDWVRDGLMATTALKTHGYELVLLDLGLPGKDGITLLRQLREDGHATPAVIITARDNVEDRILGLDVGADDYVLKPFDAKELLARMRAVLRRKAGAAAPVLSNGIVSLDPATHQATSPEAEPSILSNREFALLNALMVRPGAILSRSELEDRVYGWGEEVDSNAIEFLIYTLRKKLGSSAIQNVRGVGWMVAQA
ncbi:MAG: response regulator transcription factor, partial [Burkholderiales bacterium]